MPVAIINQKNIADWCSNDRKILVRPSCFVVRQFLLTSLLIYIFVPTSKKMAIIDTLPSRLSDRNQQLYKRLPDKSMRIKIIYISVQGKSIGNIQNYEALEGVYWTTYKYSDKNKKQIATSGHRPVEKDIHCISERCIA